MNRPTHRLDRLGFSVRADWPDGSHDIFGWRRNWYNAWRLAHRARTYWQPGPLTPHTWAILTATRRQIRAHPSGCRQPTCQHGSTVFTDPANRPTGTPDKPGTGRGQGKDQDPDDST